MLDHNTQLYKKFKMLNINTSITKKKTSRNTRAAAEAARLKADEETRSVYVPVENPDGSIQMGRAVLPTIEEAQRLRNEMAEIPVTRPSRLRRLKEIAGRVKQYLVERTRALRRTELFWNPSQPKKK